VKLRFSPISTANSIRSIIFNGIGKMDLQKSGPNQ